MAVDYRNVMCLSCKSAPYGAMLLRAAKPVLGASEPSCALFLALDLENARQQLVVMVVCRPNGHL